MAKVALEQIRARNDFYHDGYRRIMMGLLFAIAIVVVQMVIIWYLATHRPAPTYFCH